MVIFAAESSEGFVGASIFTYRYATEQVSKLSVHVSIQLIVHHS